MAKAKTAFVCSDCGSSTPKWQGQCPDCGAWNSLTEQRIASGGSTARGGYAGETRASTLADIAGEAEAARTHTGISELDRVLGGGLVAGSATLIGGDPGIGKSTLLLQAAASLSGNLPVLYVTGEESLRQVSLRAERIGIDGGAMRLLAQTCVEQVVAACADLKPRVLVVDSIQTMYTESLPSAPGTVSQLRESAAQLVRLAKTTDTAVFLVGHVTKEGVIAGPRVLEHMVDTVLYFESDAGSRYRVVRAVKNRFGAANEIGVFAMTGNGIREVKNPSAIFLSRHPESVPGSIVMAAREGTRPLLLEVQALVDDCRGGSPRRLTVGLEQNRLAMLLAVLHRHGGIAMHDQDVYVNVVGGVRVGETAADLPSLLAALSSFRDRPVSAQTVTFGEVGLAGEVRPVPFGEERLAEAAKHGYTRALVPRDNAPRKPPDGVTVIAVSRLGEALDAAFD